MRWFKRMIAWSVMVVSAFVPAFAAPHVVATIPVGMAPASIAVNPQTNRIYVANYSISGGSVSVIDGSSNTVIATVAVQSPAALICYTARNQIFTYQPQGLTIIDGSTNQIISSRRMFPTGVAAAEFGAGPVAYVADQTNGQLHVENLKTKQDIVDVSVTAPTSVTTNPAANLAYTASFGALPDVPVIDTNSNTVVNTFSPPFFYRMLRLR
jgi:YVTN family beta-propeller protein